MGAHSGEASESVSLLEEEVEGSAFLPFLHFLTVFDFVFSKSAIFPLKAVAIINSQPIYFQTFLRSVS